MLTASHKRWAQENFGACDFRDQRLNERVLGIAEAAAANPAASFPKMFPEWSDLKAAYRFFDHPRATFERIARPHWNRTRDVSKGTYLLISDTSEVNFGRERQIANTGPVGSYHSGQGFLLHSMLTVDAGQGEFLGLAAQKLIHRKPAPKKETSAARLKRPRESQKWGALVEDVGPPPKDAQFIHVMDSEADDFEVFCRLFVNNCDWVVRGYHKQRKILTEEGKEQALGDFLPTLPVVGHYELDVRKRGARKARTARLEVRAGLFCMPAPRHKSPYVQELNLAPLPMRVVWVRELDPPHSKKDKVEWVLLTSLPAESWNDVWRILEYYEHRWIIEEWHKALKTGCGLEERQLKDSARLEAVAGLFSVVAARLLRLRTEARTRPHRPARELVPLVWLEALQQMRPKVTNAAHYTIRQFIREIAKIGGFIGRKSDGEPGWITIWRGWHEFHTYLTGYQATKSYG